MVPYNYVMERKNIIQPDTPSGPAPIFNNTESSRRDHSAIIETRGAVKLHTMPSVHYTMMS